MFNSIHYDQLWYSHFLSEETDESAFSTHQHTSCELLYIIKGSGVFLIEDTAYEFSDGYVFFVPAGKYHVLKVAPKSYERCILHFAPDLLPQFANADDDLFRHADDETNALFLKFDRYADTYPEDVLYALYLSLLSELTITLSFDHEKPTLSQTEMPDIIKKVVSFIRLNINRPIHMKMLTDQFYLSESHLHHTFLQTMGISPMRYVKIKKMYAARDYLTRGYSAQKTAELLGYADYPTFYKNYKSIFGISPSETFKNAEPLT